MRVFKSCENENCKKLTKSLWMYKAFYYCYKCYRSKLKNIKGHKTKRKI